jgi:phenylalanine-4-hydroxylase
MQTSAVKTAAEPRPIPDHLLPFIAKQDPALYTPIDHAAWRFILKISKAFFAKTAHRKYLDGLEETGIATERIPLVSEMDEKLRRFGWRAVPVSGFIPPAVFMEFQALGVLPIACDMRTLEHIAYTPAPDIVHEAAGHAPIIADPEYAAYLHAYGEVSRRALLSRQDVALYEAIRLLSDIKEDPRSTPEAIAAAQRGVEQRTAEMTEPSEATELSRLFWWSVEYGLVGTLEDPKIYGAGLLSSVGESWSCLGPGVEKRPFTVACAKQGYDITRPQPQLFVTPDFPHLTKVLQEYATTMAFRVGGAEGLHKAERAASVVTVELDTGLQLGGIVESHRVDAQGRVSFVKLVGPTQLAFGAAELPGHGTERHAEGFSTVVGPLAEGEVLSALSDDDLRTRGRFAWASGIALEGRFIRSTRVDGRAIILTFDGCTITAPDGAKLYLPEWGEMDLAVGERVVSVSGGPPDRARHPDSRSGFAENEPEAKTTATEENKPYAALFARVRALRESGVRGGEAARELDAVLDEVERLRPSDWLLRWELLELATTLGLEWTHEGRVLEALAGAAEADAATGSLIGRGLALLQPGVH